MIVWRRLVLRWDWVAGAWQVRGIRKHIIDSQGNPDEPTR